MYSVNYLTYLDLIFNVTLLVSLSILSGFISKLRLRSALSGNMLQGLLFSAVVVIGMLRPVVLTQGLIFDGRSIMVSLCAYFFGPAAALIVIVFTAGLRLWIGGPGTLMGVSVIVTSAVIGLFVRSRSNPNVHPPSGRDLYVLGLLVHSIMVVLMITLPKDTVVPTIINMGIIVIVFYPLATILAGKILSDQVRLMQYIHTIRQTEQDLTLTLQSIGDAVISTDNEGNILYMNSAAERLTGWRQSEVFRKPLEFMFQTVDAHTKERLENPIRKAIHIEQQVEMTKHVLLKTKEDYVLPITGSATPKIDQDGRINGAVLSFQDQSRSWYIQQIIQARIDLMEYKHGHTLDELVRKSLDITCELVDSPIGFYNFVDVKQGTLSFCQWSSNTITNCCSIQDREMIYDISQAGVLADCIREGKPIIHNDYESLPHAKGLPDGHPHVVRELVVPVIRSDRVAAIMGVGNKLSNYAPQDIELVSYLADVTWELVGQKQTEEALLDSEQRYRGLFENAPIGIFILSPESIVLSCNRTMANLMGFSTPKEGIDYYNKHPDELYVTVEQQKEALTILKNKGYFENYEYELRLRTGEIIILRVNAHLVKPESGEHRNVEGFATDITAQRTIERQYLQAQKMDTVGHLAGGIAHDFNNLLSVILGYAELAADKVSASHPIREDLEEIINAAEHSAQLTQQLLAFARKKMYIPKVIVLNEVIEHMLKMLTRIVGESIAYIWLPGENLPLVKMDPSQVEQVVSNVCINSRDAIEGTGRIIIETRKTVIDNEYCENYAGCTPGDYILLTVSDDGCGMDAETQERIFEPFFTTKAEGIGIGLGLPTVQEIITQNNGYIHVYSELGKGTTIKVYIPVHHGDSQKPDTVVPLEYCPHGNGETILLVEDDVSILNLSKEMLGKLNYSVIATHSPNEALHIASSSQEHIDLLLTDMIMPEMNGKELAKKIQKHCPKIKVLYMSGYTADFLSNNHKEILDDDVNFIQKPFSLNSIAAYIQSVLSKQ